MSLARQRRVEVAVALSLLLVAACGAAFDRSSRVALPADARTRLAWARVSREAISEGQPPVWNPYYLGGQPLVGNPEAAALYPPDLVLRSFPLRHFIALTFVLHAWVLGLGIFAVVRLLGESWPTASMAALAVMTGVAFAAPAFSTSPLLPSVAWLPLIVAAALSGSECRRRAPSPLLVLSLATVLLGGAVRASWYAVGAVVGSYAYAALWSRRSNVPPRMLVLQCVIALVLAAGLSAVQTIPAWWLRSQVRRGELGYLATSNDSPRAPARPNVQRLLAVIGSHRTISTCADVTPADLAIAGVPTADGWTLYPKGLARFASLASGVYPAREGAYETILTAGTRSARTDLLAWLGVEYLVACDVPDSARWRRVAGAGAISVYRSTQPRLMPIWTCAARAVTRDEIEYELATRIYDQQLTLAERRVVIHVRWTPSVTDPQRMQAEADLHLVPMRAMGDRTWQYSLDDTTPSNVRAVVTNPLVEDTAYINRSLEAQGPPRPIAAGQPKSEWLIGAEPCANVTPVRVVRTRPFRARYVLQVDAPSAGLVVVPESYFPGRRAWVDGKPVTPLRVNLAFIGIPVDAGAHRLDLSYRPDTLWVGAAVSVLTLAGWLAVGRRAAARVVPPPRDASI